MAARSCSIIRAIKHVYDVTVFSDTISVTVTNHPDAITEWINGVDAVGITAVGFEIELHYNHPPIGTVQLCVGGRCLVIQLVPDVSPFPPSLREFLGDPNIIFVGFKIKDKMKTLSQQVPIGGAEVQICTLDLSELKEAPRLVKNKKKVFVECGLKSERMENDWGRATMLSEKQVMYACIDALFNLQAAMGIVRNLDYNPARFLNFIHAMDLVTLLFNL